MPTQRSSPEGRRAQTRLLGRPCAVVKARMRPPERSASPPSVPIQRSSPEARGAGARGVDGGVGEARGAVEDGEAAVGVAGEPGVGGDPERVAIARLSRLPDRVDRVVRKARRLVERPEGAEADSHDTASLRPDPDVVPRSAPAEEREGAVRREAHGGPPGRGPGLGDPVEAAPERRHPERGPLGAGDLEERVHGGAGEPLVVVGGLPAARGQDVEAAPRSDPELRAASRGVRLEERPHRGMRVVGRRRHGCQASPLEEREPSGRPDPERLGVGRGARGREDLDRAGRQAVLFLPAGPGSSPQAVEPPAGGPGPDRGDAVPSRASRRATRRRRRGPGAAARRARSSRRGGGRARPPRCRPRGSRPRRGGAPSPTASARPREAGRPGRRDRSRRPARPASRPRGSRSRRSRAPAPCSAGAPRGRRRRGTTAVPAAPDRPGPLRAPRRRRGAAGEARASKRDRALPERGLPEERVHDDRAAPPRRLEGAAEDGGGGPRVVEEEPPLRRGPRAASW